MTRNTVYNELYKELGNFVANKPQQKINIDIVLDRIYSIDKTAYDVRITQLSIKDYKLMEMDNEIHFKYNCGGVEFTGVLSDFIHSIDDLFTVYEAAQIKSNYKRIF